MLNFFFNPKGRVSRKAYWLGFMLPLFGVSLALSAGFAAYVFNNGGAAAWEQGDPKLLAGTIAENLILLSTFAAPVYLVIAWSYFAVSVKRLHDRGRSWWWILTPLAPTIFAQLGVGAGIYLQQTAGPNMISNVVFGAGVFFLLATVGTIFWLCAIMFFLPGEKRDNQYGANPLEAPA